VLARGDLLPRDAAGERLRVVGVYTDPLDETMAVHDDDTVLVTRGYHASARRVTISIT
jgi:5-deoxy-D-glucuronate isomerase